MSYTQEELDSLQKYALGNLLLNKYGDRAPAFGPIEEGGYVMVNLDNKMQRIRIDLKELEAEEIKLKEQNKPGWTKDVSS